MLHQFDQKKPVIKNDVFVADSSQIIGNVFIDEKASIWFNAVIRGDLEAINIGRNSNIQENCSLHVDINKPLQIGNNVTVGHGAILHGCTVENNCLIGMGATILNDVIIGPNTIIGAGALIPEGKHIPGGSLVVGLPGKVIRELKQKEKEQIKEHADNYYQLAKKY